MKCLQTRCSVETTSYIAVTFVAPSAIGQGRRLRMVPHKNDRTRFPLHMRVFLACIAMFALCSVWLHKDIDWSGDVSVILPRERSIRQKGATAQVTVAVAPMRRPVQRRHTTKKQVQLGHLNLTRQLCSYAVTNTTTRIVRKTMHQSPIAALDQGVTVVISVFKAPKCLIKQLALWQKCSIVKSGLKVMSSTCQRKQFWACWADNTRASETLHQSSLIHYQTKSPIAFCLEVLLLWHYSALMSTSSIHVML